MKYPAVLALAQSQHNAMTSTELQKYVSKRTIANWTASGLMHHFAAGVYVFSNSLTWEEQLRACWLSSPDLIVGCRSAAQFWGIAPMRIGNLEFVTASNTNRRLPSAKVYESNCLDDSHWLFRNGLNVTTPARTIVSLSAVWGPDLIKRSLHKALDNRLLTVAEVRRSLDSVRRRGRRRVRFLDMVLEDPHFDESKNRSWLAREAYALLMKAKLPKPAVERAIPLKDYTLHPDLCYPEIGLALEVDGFESHGTRLGFDDDHERDALLALAGWEVVRFSSKTLHVLPEIVQSKLTRRSAHT